MESKFKSQFKKGITTEDSRRRREENVTALRKEKKEEGLAKRRNLMVDNFMEKSATSITTNTTSSSQIANTNGNARQAYTIADIPALMQGMQSPDVATQLTSLRGFRRLLSSERNPPVQQCIDCGAVPMFVKFLQRSDSQELQFEAAWALTNIASTDRTSLIVECGAVPYLSQLLTCESADIREQCAWCLGNVAGDGADLRDVVLGCNSLPALVLNVAQPASISLLRNCTWALSNFCRGKPQPPLNVVAPALQALVNIVNSCTDQETVVDATWALSYISDGDNNRIQAVVDLGVIPFLIEMLRSGKGTAIVPALRTLGNFVSGNDSQTQAVVDANVLSALVPLLSHSKKNVRKETCWMLSNIAAGSQSQLSALVSTHELLPKVLAQLSVSSEWDVRREASWVISNIATGGNSAILQQLVDHGTIRPLCDLLSTGEVRVLLLAMEALESFFKCGIDRDQLIKLIDEAEGIDKLELLQEHENNEVYQRSMKMIETYFSDDAATESENIAPTAGANSYSFGIQTTGKAAFDFGANSAFMQQQQNQQQFTMNGGFNF